MIRLLASMMIEATNGEIRRKVSLSVRDARRESNRQLVLALTAPREPIQSLNLKPLTSILAPRHPALAPSPRVVTLMSPLVNTIMELSSVRTPSLSELVKNVRRESSRPLVPDLTRLSEWRV